MTDARDEWPWELCGCPDSNTTAKVDVSITPGQGDWEPDVIFYPGGASRSGDAEATRYDLISPIGHRRLAARCALGAEQYGAHNWESGMPATAVVNHLERHLNLYKMGNREDDHLAAIAWAAYALMHYEATDPTGYEPFPDPQAASVKNPSA